MHNNSITIKKSYIFNLLTQAINIIIPIVTTPYLIRTLGDENIGFFNYAQSIVSYFVLFGCLGLNTYGQREIAYNYSYPEKRLTIFRELFLIRLITFSIAISLYIVFLLLFADLKICYAVMSIELLANAIDINWYYLGKVNFALQFYRTAIIKIIGALTIFLFVKNENDLIIYILCYSLSIFIGNGLMWFDFNNQISIRTRTKINLKHHIIPLLMMFIPEVAINVYTQLNKTMLGILTGLDYSSVAFYSQADRIVKLALTVITSLGGIMYSVISKALTDEGNSGVQKYFYKSFKYMMLLACPISIGLFLVSSNFVTWFFGDTYLRISTCIKILSPLIIVIGISNLIGIQYMLPLKKMREYIFSIMVGVITNIVFNIFFIPRYFDIGASIANLFAELAVSITQLLMVRKEINIKALFWQWRPVLSSVVMGVILFFFDLYLNASIISTAIEIMVGMVIYLVCLYIMKEPLLYDVIDRIKIKKK